MGMANLILSFIKRLPSEPLVVLKTIFLYLWLRCFTSKRRLDLYDPRKEEDLTKIDVVIPPLEQEIDGPSQTLQENASDSILIYGGSDSGARLLVRVCREKGGHVPWILLRLPDGRSYLPVSPDKLYPPAADFTGGGLRLKCRNAFRKWRISFNGMLRETIDGQKESKIVHVKFSFLCLSSSYPFDLSTDIHPLVMADYMARRSFFPSLPRRNSIKNNFDVIVQAVNLLGTISIDGSEDSEMFLWGARKRSRELRKSFGKMHMNEFIGYSKDGQLIYSGEAILPGSKVKLPFAFYVERSTLNWPVIKSRHSFKRREPSFSGMQIHIKNEKRAVSVSVSGPSDSVRLKSPCLESKCYLVKFAMDDGDKGHGVSLDYTWSSQQSGTFKKPAWNVLHASPPKPTALLLPLEDPSCQDKLLTGGKGASLANLTYLAHKYKTNFKVPGGFVVTTHAYKDFFNKAGVQAVVTEFENKVWSFDADKIKRTCDLLVERVSKANLPAGLKQAIEKQLSKQFTDVSRRRFAVRSSASGEDSEEMSAAGQMSTFLGVEGIEDICNAIVKCWASQFAFTAIQYKRQNGQELNSLMAVVVQEMVAADSAGVLFTCDPVTGNPQNITITANYGLGESVVSAAVDPDTVVLRRDERNELSISSVIVGKKSIKIVMGDKGKVLGEEVGQESSADCCLTEKNALSIAETGLKIEEAYGLPIDIEWAFKDNQLYMLQARPVTTIDVETRFEVAHAISSSIRAENEFHSKANVGEVMPGASTHFGGTANLLFFLHLMQVTYGWRNKFAFPFNPFYQRMVCHQNHIFVNMPNMILRFYRKDTKSFLSEANMIAGFGRVLEDEELCDQADKRNRMYPTTFLPLQILYFIVDILFGEKRMLKASEAEWNREIDIKKCSSSKEMFYHIWKEFIKRATSVGLHSICSMNSALYNNLLMGILAKGNKGWGVNVFSDFSMILSSCGKSESADIPRSMLMLIKEIKKAKGIENFKQMSTEDALKWLETTNTTAGKSYKDFINRHGHRCISEFDVYSKPWRINKLPFIKTLQDTISNSSDEEKPFESAAEVISKLKVPLSWPYRTILRLLIPLSRKAVMSREKSKSYVVKVFDHSRIAFWALAKQLVKEGRLPDHELMFFLTQHEVMELIETRNPSLVQMAIRRRRILPELDKLKFPEITRGIPKAVILERNIHEDDSKSDLEIHGTPVSQGVITAFVRVANDIEEAANIKHGEILIAYSTDIAWSPYFPLLSGVATELGGLISHGAVVAREYGLPCVVGVHDATLRFKTGDYVRLDGSKGVLKRLKPPKN